MLQFVPKWLQDDAGWFKTRVASLHALNALEPSIVGSGVGNNQGEPLLRNLIGKEVGSAVTDWSFFSLMKRFGMEPAWEGISEEEQRQILKEGEKPKVSNEPVPPTPEELVAWQEDKILSRLFADSRWHLSRSPLTPQESDQLESLGRMTSEQNSSGTQFAYDEINWLAKLITKYRGPNYLFSLLARFWEERSTLRGNLFDLTRASSYWRRAAYPEFAVRTLEKTKSADDPRLRAYAHTSRGAAFKDQNRLDDAEFEAKQAIRLEAKLPSYFPYVLLGVIRWKKGDIDGALGAWSKAAELGFRGFDNNPIDIHVIDTMSAEDKEALGRRLLRIAERLNNDGPDSVGGLMR